MQLADIDSFTELARRVGQRGLGERTLRKLANDDPDRSAQRRDLIAIADATNVPYEFFTASFDRLRDEATPGLPAPSEMAAILRDVQERLAQLERHVGATPTADDAPAVPASELLRLPEDDASSRDSGGSAGSRREADARPGSAR